MSSGLVYTVSGENLTLGTGNVLLAFRTAADAVTAGGLIEILRLHLSQSGTATAAQCRAETFTRDTAGTLTMTSVTPSNRVVGGRASALIGSTAPAGTAARIGINSSADSGGTYTQRRPFNFNNLNGELWVPTPEERRIIPPATVWGVRFTAAPGTTTGWCFSVDYAEIA